MDARRNLELSETLRVKDKKGTLLWVLDKTRTPMGGRLLRSWLEKPLLDAAEIISRQNAVEELVGDTLLRGELEEALKCITDFERVMTRIVTGTVNCRDLLGFAGGLRALPDIKRLLQQCKSPLLKKLEAQLETMNHRGFTGYLVQEIADEKYFDNPFDADVRNMRVLERFIEE